MADSKTPRILLAGIAKDEAAYLPEWIFHHLNLGVTGVMIYINNTSDTSTEILEDIAQHYPVSYKIVDGIDKNDSPEIMKRIGDAFLEYAPLHCKSYADIYNNADNSEYDYILYLDIDEYLCLDKSLDTLAKEGLFKHPVINFQWFSVTGEQKPFDVLNTKVRGEYDQFSKYMIQTGHDEVKLFSSHNGRIKKQERYHYKGGIVLHRVLRSKVEYLALIARSNPSSNNLSNGFKLNRRGWTTKGSETLPEAYYYIYDGYEQNFQQFCQDCGIQTTLDHARENVSNRSKAVIELIGSLSKQNSELGRVLDGAGVSHFSLLNWFQAEFKNKLVRLLFPSLVIKHVPIMNHIKFKLGLYSKDKFLD